MRNIFLLLLLMCSTLINAQNPVKLKTKFFGELGYQFMYGSEQVVLKIYSIDINETKNVTASHIKALAGYNVSTKVSLALGIGYLIENGPKSEVIQSISIQPHLRLHFSRNFYSYAEIGTFISVKDKSDVLSDWGWSASGINGTTKLVNRFMGGIGLGYSIPLFQGLKSNITAGYNYLNYARSVGGLQSNHKDKRQRHSLVIGINFKF